MITESDGEQRNERGAFVLSLLASLVLNLAVWMLAIWGAGVQLKLPITEIKEPELIVSSSSIRIEHRTVPQPVSAHAKAVRPQPKAAAAHPVIQHAPVPVPQARPTEIARIVPHASPQPHPARARSASTSLQQQLAQQEQMFAREAQSLNAARSPLSVATSGPVAPSSKQISWLDTSGRAEQRETVEALLEPLPGHHWIADGMSCYYVHYFAQYGGGGTEEGNIPWPLCYPVGHDAMLPLDRSHRLPIPKPPAGYVLPPGTTLQPLLDAIYKGQVDRH